MELLEELQIAVVELAGYLQAVVVELLPLVGAQQPQVAERVQWLQVAVLQKQTAVELPVLVVEQIVAAAQEKRTVAAVGLLPLVVVH